MTATPPSVCKVCKCELHFPDQFVIVKSSVIDERDLLSVSQGGGLFDVDGSTRMLQKLSNHDVVIAHYLKKLDATDTTTTAVNSSNFESSSKHASATLSDSSDPSSALPNHPQQQQPASSRSSRTSRKERLCETCCNDIERTLTSEICDEEERLQAYLALEKQLDQRDQLRSVSSSETSSLSTTTTMAHRVTAFDIADAVNALQRQTQLHSIAQRRVSDMLRALDAEANRWRSTLAEQRRIYGDLFTAKDKVTLHAPCTRCVVVNRRSL